MSDDVELADVPALFERWLAGRPLAERSRREYARNVRAFCGWLADTPDRAGWQGDPLTDPLARDHAAREFRRYLQVERRAAASTVNLALASLDALYRCLGLGRPHVRRDKPALAGPRALDEAGQRRLLRAAEAAPIRPRSLVMLMLFTALRISETVALDVDDVRIMTRKGVLVVIGKGDVQREVPLNALVRQVLDEWLKQRNDVAADGERALFVSRTGGRLSARSADRDVRLVAAAAGLELSAHTLRHTCLTALVRRGNDLVMVAELAGHQKLETLNQDFRTRCRSGRSDSCFRFRRRPWRRALALSCRPARAALRAHRPVGRIVT